MISEIFNNQTLCIENILYSRSWITQQGFNELLTKMENLLIERMAKKSGSIITITNAIEMQDGQAVMDVEILIPLEKEIDITDDFKFIHRLEITNALKIRIDGNPQQLQQATHLLTEYIAKNKLNPTTPLIVVNVNGKTAPLKIDAMITDIYIGVKVD